MASVVIYHSSIMTYINMFCTRRYQNHLVTYKSKGIPFKTLIPTKMNSEFHMINDPLVMSSQTSIKHVSCRDLILIISLPDHDMAHSSWHKNFV